MEIRKVQFGCGGNILPGWGNHDADVDITQRLPYEDNSVDFIFCEHCIEHVTPAESIRFLMECHRILKPKGVVRITFPNVYKLKLCATPEYHDFISKNFTGGKVSNLQGSLLAATFCHGHKGFWTLDSMEMAFLAAGFRGDSITPFFLSRETKHPELRDVEGHWKVVGETIADIESSSMEGVK